MHGFYIFKKHPIFWQNVEPKMVISQTNFTSGFIFAVLTLAFKA